MRRPAGYWPVHRRRTGAPVRRPTPPAPPMADAAEISASDCALTCVQPHSTRAPQRVQQPDVCFLLRRRRPPCRHPSMSACHRARQPNKQYCFALSHRDGRKGWTPGAQPTQPSCGMKMHAGPTDTALSLTGDTQPTTRTSTTSSISHKAALSSSHACCPAPASRPAPIRPAGALLLLLLRRPRVPCPNPIYPTSARLLLHVW